MMGDYCIYSDGVLFGLICDDKFYLKVTNPGRAILNEVILRCEYALEFWKSGRKLINPFGKVEICP
jgi:hypothetical protein